MTRKRARSSCALMIRSRQSLYAKIFVIICPQDQSWCLQSPVLASGLRIGPDTKLKKLARAFVHVDKYGVKFRDDAKSDTFIKNIEKAKYHSIHRFTHQYFVAHKFSERKGEPPRKKKMSMIHILGSGSNTGSLRSVTSTDSPALPRNTNGRLSAPIGDENDILNLLLEVFGGEK